jgi:hypothetical protein
MTFSEKEKERELQKLHEEVVNLPSYLASFSSESDECVSLLNKIVSQPVYL